MWSILVMWFECRFLDTEVDGTNPDLSMLCPSARHFIRITSVDSAVKWVPGGDNLVNGVQCYEHYGWIALKNHACFLFSLCLWLTDTQFFYFNHCLTSCIVLLNHLLFFISSSNCLPIKGIYALNKCHINVTIIIFYDVTLNFFIL